MKKLLWRAYLKWNDLKTTQTPYFKITCKDDERGIRIHVKPRWNVRGAIHDKIVQNVVAQGKDKDSATRIAQKSLSLVYQWFNDLSEVWYWPFVVTIKDIKQD
jgi:hypothetical protein